MSPSKIALAARHIAIIGGGPAGLMAAEVARAGGADVTLHDHLASVGRKILIAGKGGLNLTHSEPKSAFVQRYRERAGDVAAWLDAFDADALRDWARGLGIDMMVGSSGRVFPTDLRAAPLLRGWVRRLREQGVQFRMQQRFRGWDDDGALRFDTADGPQRVHADATILALGGGSWARLGSDGVWVDALRQRGIGVAPLRPANCGFECDWSEHIRERHAGAPVKPVAASTATTGPLQGEFVITRDGIEGSLVYALSAELREQIDADGRAELRLDLLPGRTQAQAADALRRPRGKRSLSEHLRRAVGIDGVRLGLLFECSDRARLVDPDYAAAQMKALPLMLRRTRPLDEAISSAGGVRFEALDEQLMLEALPGVFCAGEMIDWEAPTGGYLLTACMASGRVAALGALRWLENTGSAA